MDRDRFDALARLLATKGSRRGTLGAILGVALFGQGPEDGFAKPGKGKQKGRGKGTGRKQRKKKGGRGNGGGQPAPPPECCGTEACPDPEPGSTRSGCDFGGQSFAGQDLNGSIFRGIDGRDAVFTATDNQGSIFAEACLQGARFRRARLGGSTWGDACLFGADFTGADFGDDLTLFDDARFCGTRMPDGSVNDRDCGRETSCCRAEVGGGDPGCQRDADCADQPCETKACTNGRCVYQPVIDGPSPNDECAGHCCEGLCCGPGADQCNPLGLCCAPNCAGRACGPDGCGGDGGCGTCPTGETCDEDSGQCRCTRQSCRDGCCDAGGRCQPGNTDGACGSGGGTCAQCTAQQACVNGACVTVSCTGTCNNDNDCPDFRNCVCNRAQGVCCQRNCSDKDCGPDGCGGFCGACPPNTTCVGGNCVCDATTCPSGCCTNGPGNPGACRQSSDATCGTGGEQCVNCPAGTVCANGACICTAQGCPNGCCSNGPGNPGTCQPNSDRTCGRNGVLCVDCPAGTACDPGNFDGVCVCNAQSCPNGCCATDTGPCLPGNTNQNCGANGGQCDNCASILNICVNRTCVCTAQTCSVGCCPNGPGNPGECAFPSDRTCGHNGVLCVDCPAGNACVDGACVCNAASCPNGCCSNGPGQPGTCHASSDRTCGANGVPCGQTVDCVANENACVNGVCVCNGTWCSRCCSNGPGNPGACEPRTNETCGSGGAQCVDCSRTCGGGCVCNTSTGQCN
jgi:hypothetical protein